MSLLARKALIPHADCDLETYLAKNTLTCEQFNSVPRPTTNPIMAMRPFHVSAKLTKPNWDSVWSVMVQWNWEFVVLFVEDFDQPATAEMLWGAWGKLVGIGSGFPSARALARIYIWLEVDPAVSIALATRSQLRISVDIWMIWDKSLIKLKASCGYPWPQRPSKIVLIENTNLLI